MKMSDEEALRIANETARPHGLTAEYLSDDPSIRTVGVQGDQRTWERPIVLVGAFPGWDVLATVSKAISNRTPINKVTFELAAKKE